jgi:hypothetical protein
VAPPAPACCHPKNKPYVHLSGSALPVLADALEEEGLAAPEVLQHCREGGGPDAWCWVLGLAWGCERGPGP